MRHRGPQWTPRQDSRALVRMVICPRWPAVLKWQAGHRARPSCMKTQILAMIMAQMLIFLMPQRQGRSGLQAHHLHRRMILHCLASAETGPTPTLHLSTAMPGAIWPIVICPRWRAVPKHRPARGQARLTHIQMLILAMTTGRVHTLPATRMGLTISHTPQLIAWLDMGREVVIPIAHHLRRLIPIASLAIKGAIHRHTAHQRRRTAHQRRLRRTAPQPPPLPPHITHL